MGLGFWELALILAGVVLIFGTGRLPKVGSDVARTFRNFRAGIRDEPAEAPPPPPAGGAQPGPPPRLAPPYAAGPGAATADEDTLAR